MLLQHTISRAAERRPEATALVDGKQRLTYGDLDILSNRIARLLVASGCRKGDRVALLLPKSIRAIAGMLGTLKAGGIYVPMDTASPPARLQRIIDICEPACILAAGPAAPLLNALRPERGMGDGVRVGWLDDADPPDPRFDAAFAWSDCQSAAADPLACSATEGDPAHILFTSGSTGMPKGVVITHRSVVRFLSWAAGYFGTKPTDRISCHPPLHFDLSTFDIYGTFLAGAELDLVPPEVSLLPRNLADFIRERELTQWFSVPSALKYMAQFDVVKQGDFPSLERLLWCGEALPTPTLIYWMRRLPHVTFTNLYGPTETTIASSYYTVPSCPASEKEEIPVGRACDGEELLVLDESLAPVGAGEIGDLYIRGVGLSPGYWRDPEKTASVFLEANGGRMYKTGDLARVGDDGLVYLLGRADSQIKSRGYRIELGEIESALYALGTVRECAVVAIPTDGFEGNAICCAYVDRSPGGTSPAQLRDQIARLVPSYMLPSQWISVDALPLNGNGKVDRPRLRQQFQERAGKPETAAGASAAPV
jgi:amino acid adenylation domain-containing protein